MDIEALMAAAAQTHTNDGGANCAPCGSLGTDPILDVLAAESPNRKIADLTCTYAILDMIRQKFPAAETLGQVREHAALRKKEQARQAEEAKAARAAAGLPPKTTPRSNIRTPRYSTARPRLRKPILLPEVGTTLRNGRRRRTTRSSARSARRCSAKPCVASFRVRTS